MDKTVFLGVLSCFLIRKVCKTKNNWQDARERTTLSDQSNEISRAERSDLATKMWSTWPDSGRREPFNQTKLSIFVPISTGTKSKETITFASGHLPLHGAAPPKGPRGTIHRRRKLYKLQKLPRSGRRPIEAPLISISETNMYAKWRNEFEIP